MQAYEQGGNDGTAEGYNYDEWHIGNVNIGDAEIGEASFNFENPAGITLIPSSITGAAHATQLFKGYNIDDLNEQEPMTAEEFIEFVNGISIVAEGNVHLQIAGQVTIGDVAAGWTTLRPAAAHGTVDASDIDEWVGTGTLADRGSFTIAGLEGLVSFKVFGVGVVADSGEALIESITFGGDTYSFAAVVEEEVEDETTDPTPPTTVETARQ